jgi:hypothetical protein
MSIPRQIIQDRKVNFYPVTFGKEVEGIPVMDTLRKYLTEDYAYCVQALDRGYRAFLNWEIRLDHLRPSRPNTALEFAERDRNSPSYEYKQMMKRYEATSHGSDKRD